MSCSSPKSPDTAGDLFSSCSGFRQCTLQPGLLQDALGKRFNTSQCNGLPCYRRHGICALKTLERARKPGAEAPGGDPFEETSKKPAWGPSVLCICDKRKYSHPPPLVNAAPVNALTLHPQSPCGASQPREPSGHEHSPLPKANGPAVMGAGQQLKIAQKAE